MKCPKSLFPLIAILAFGCECDESLDKICPPPEPCYVNEGDENIEKNLILGKYLESINTKGQCQLGTTECFEDSSRYCVGVVYPSEEVCDFSDNNCDGNVDEGFDLDQDGFKTCEGDCRDGDPAIHPGAPERCNAVDDDCDGIIPENERVDNDQDGLVECADCDDMDYDVNVTRLEICDGKDNDCDGEIDENVMESWNTCGPDTDIGVCTKGTSICEGGELYCVGANYGSGEVCDGLDNNCDGRVDEDLIQECFTDCGWGIEYCYNGFYQGCTAPDPVTEVCDGIDNDCDGEIDENCECEIGSITFCTDGVIDPISLEFINCGVGTSICMEDGEWGPCFFTTILPESCNNHDDDCDGEIDGLIEECGDRTLAGVGECRLGETRCTNGEWGECEGSVGPLDEVCDGKDNDCDSLIDEDLDPHEKVDIVFAIDGSGSMCPYVDALKEGISEYVVDFETSEHRFGLIVFPEQYDYQLRDPHFMMTPGLVGVSQFVSILDSYTCEYPAQEPSLDVIYDLVNPFTTENPTGIEWRSDAYPYIIMMTDEESQSWLGYTATEIGQELSNCTIGECEPGDRVEFFIFTNTQYYGSWSNVAYNDPGRIIEIGPPVGERYAELLRGVFTNVCIGF